MSVTNIATGDINFGYDYNINKINDTAYSLCYFYKIPYTKLYFLKKANQFVSHYQINLSVLKQKELVAGKSFKKEILLNKYEDTQHSTGFTLDSTSISFNYFPGSKGKLVLNTIINDLNSNNTGSTKFDISIPDLTNRIEFYLNHTLNPNHSYSISHEQSDTLNIYLQIYSPETENCSLSIVKEAMKKSNDLTYSTTKNHTRRVVYQSFFPVQTMPTNVSMTLITKFIDFSYPIVNLKDFGSGTYRVIIRGYDSIGKKEFETADSFPVEDAFFYSNAEYSEMVNRLIYMATESEINKLRQAPLNNRESLWNDFWKKHDPTPTTDINEEEDEYFSRIEYCIEHFSNSDRGYKSDRAKIYMKYGPPDLIESRPFERESDAYEIWSYYNISKQFTFVDYHGFGEFILYKEANL
jgi:GWxTD domain-containing protein